MRSDSGIEYTTPPLLGDADKERDYLREVDRYREAATSRYTVAPRCTVTSMVTGRGTLQQGDPIYVQDVVSTAAMNELVRLGVAIEIPENVARLRKYPGDASHRVAHTALTAPGKIVAPGELVGPSTWARPPQAAIEPQPAHLTANGSIRAAIAGRPELPGSDGTEVIGDLEAKGYLEPLSDEELEEIHGGATTSKTKKK